MLKGVDGVSQKAEDNPECGGHLVETLSLSASENLKSLLYPESRAALTAVVYTTSESEKRHETKSHSS